MTNANRHAPLSLQHMVLSLMAARQHLATELRIATRAGLHDYAAALMREAAELDHLIDEARASVHKLTTPEETP